MFKSLRYRLLLWFVLSTFIISGLLISLFHVQKVSEAEHLSTIENLQFFRYQFLKDQNQVTSFLSSDVNDKHFYITGESNFLNNHYGLITNIDSCFVAFYTTNSNHYPELRKSLYLARNVYTDYCILLDSLVYNVYSRGFQDFGLEGELNSYMFQLEQQELISKEDLKELKIAEREYLHRIDTTFIPIFNSRCDILEYQIHLNQSTPTQYKDNVIALIESYRSSFKRIVSLDKKIGFSKNNGLKQQLNIAENQLEAILNSSISQVSYSFGEYKSKLNKIIAFVAFFLIAIAFALSIYTSRYLVKHLESLGQYISNLTKSDFSHNHNFDLRHSTTEIRQIYKAFRNMLAELRIREKQRDIALLKAEDNKNRYRELSDLLPQCIYETDQAGKLTYANKAWFDTFGYTSCDFNQGINLSRILNADENSSLFGNTKIEDNDYIATRKDLTQFPSTVYSDVIRKGMRVIGRRGIIIDSTIRNKYIESLKNETMKAVTSDKHKSSFLANMSHEIRTPMNSIIGFSHMLSSKEIPDEQKESFISHIRSSSEMLLNLVDDIIDIAKIEVGQLKITKAECTPVKLINDLAGNFEAYKKGLDKDHLDIKLVLPDNEIFVKTDGFRLKQVLTNLISNAIKFTEKGWIEIGLNLKNNRVLEFYVKDTGMGMSKSELATIFERFKRAKLSEEKKISGTGLGLAIVKNLIEMLGGSMWVTSESGVGSKFSFEIPYIRIIKPITEIVKVDENADYKWHQNTILIAEDDDKNFEYVNHLISETGAKIIRAKNGKEAIDALSFHKNIDLILMDLQMPVLNGLQSTQQIKEQHKYLPIIAQTAFAMEGDREKCIAAGCDDYITKPIEANNLLAKIAQFIKNKPKDISNNTIKKDVSGNLLIKKIDGNKNSDL